MMRKKLPIGKTEHFTVKITYQNTCETTDL